VSKDQLEDFGLKLSLILGVQGGVLVAVALLKVLKGEEEKRLRGIDR